MNRNCAIILAVVLLLGLVCATGALAQEGYQLSWWTVDGGGGTLSEGSYTLNSAIGQPEAAAPLSAGKYSLRGGFLQPVRTSITQIYLPVIQH